MIRLNNCLALFVVAMVIGVLGRPVLAGDKDGTRTFDAPGHFLTGNDWRRLDKFVQGGYAMGILDGMVFASAMDHASDEESVVDWLGPCMSKMQADQVVAIINQRMDKNPADWHQSMQAMVYTAMFQACGKAKQPTK